jgi:transcriptional regulator with XRE-family HTH domain
MISVMPAKAPALYPTSQRLLLALGERLRLARLRRAFSAETVCTRANISRPTLTKIEKGDASVTMGSYLQVLRVLEMEQDLMAIAADDVVGRRLQDAGMARRERAPRRPKVLADAGVLPPPSAV